LEKEGGDDMKKVLIAGVIFTLFSAPAWAGELYVKSVKAKIFAAPSFGSDVIETATRGDAITELKRKNRWVNVTFRGKKGWVSGYLLSKTPPMKRVSVLKESASIEESARRRASSFTSVAAARGLNEYGRVRKDKLSYAIDYDALDRMESIDVDELEAQKFIEEGVDK